MTIQEEKIKDQEYLNEDLAFSDLKIIFKVVLWFI